MAKKREEQVSRKEREKHQHRVEILEAAERVFVDKGFDYAPVEEIAREAEFSVGAIYNFFENKEDLYSKVMFKIAEDFRATFRKQTDTTDNPLEAIAAGIHLRLDHVEEHGGFLRLFMDSKPGSRIAPDSAVPQNCREIYDAYVSEVATLFKHAMSKRSIRKADPLYTALSLEGAINAFTAYWRRKEMSVPLKKQVEIVLENFLQPLIVRTGDEK